MLILKFNGTFHNPIGAFRRKADYKNDRLAAGNTLEQYERAYTQAFVDAVKAVDPKWEVGKPIASGVLDSVTRESVESNLVQSGNQFVRKSVDYSV
jgi:hypothetical protein